MEVADAAESDSRGNEQTSKTRGRTDLPDDPTAEPPAAEESDGEYQSEDEDEEDEEDDEEPRLKYGSLTKSLGALYRNGDATSASLLSGDRMIVGTHNGNIHVYAVPSFQRLRVYRAHSASVSSISISPFPLPPPELSSVLEEENIAAQHSKSTNQPRQPVLPQTPSNSIYIATSSIEGHVCVASLIDQKDVLLRNFGRPVQSVALSPRYKVDRTYVSGGLAGCLVRTTGGRVGTSSNSTVMGGTTAPSAGWLGTFGLGGNSGTDSILHSGEGPISTIKWSLSGKFIAWVNEEGIKIMRSNLDLDSSESEFEWKTVGHIDRPNLPGWEELASVWKARAEWVDTNTMEHENGPSVLNLENGHGKRTETEKLIIGWGGTIWIINVFPGRVGTGKGLGKSKIEFSKMRLDCIVSGVSLYTPNQLLVLSYIIPENKGCKSQSKQAGPGRGIRHRQNGLQPELRLIDIDTKEELMTDTLAVRRYETLSASDYHLGVLPPLRVRASSTTQKGTLGSIGTGLLDATLYPVRLFSSAGSVRSNTSSGDRGSSLHAEGSFSVPVASRDKQARELAMSATKGVKIFIHSPYDCAVAVKRDVEDRLAWLTTHEKYGEAWDLVDKHPEAVITVADGFDSAPPTPTQRQGSLAEFLRDDSASSIEVARQLESSRVEKEKARISGQWLEQLINNDKWEKAGQICGKVLTATPGWEHWIWTFARNNKFDEIAPFVPTDISPPLPSLIYEVILGHYVSRDRQRFKELLQLWPSNLFEIGSITAAIEDQLKSPSVVEDTEDWRILMDCLAKLSLEGGRPREALRCYIRIQDAETAMDLIRKYHLLGAVADDIAGFILMRVPKGQIKSSTIAELAEATSEPINLLVRDAANGIVPPEDVVSQLEAADLHLFLYFYFRRLWKGEASAIEKRTIRMRGHRQADAAEKLVADEGRALTDSFADTVVGLFADYDRPLLMEFLQSNTAYSYSAASSICELRHFTHELIYLFSKTGQTKRALQLILSDLKDISHAISFAKSQDDSDLWDDLLSYSMDKPEYIRCLLAEGGTSIDPIKLVRRIPSGLEIEGLREGLTRMIREHDIQASICQGVAKVLMGEVASRMNRLRDGQRRGIKFGITPEGDEEETGQAGRCAGCQKPFAEQEQESLVGFACGHIYHVSHLHEDPDPPSDQDRPPRDSYDDSSPFFSRTVGLKVTNARLLRDRVGSGCRICAQKETVEQ